MRDKRKFLSPPEHVRRSSAAWDRDVVECMMKDMHSLYKCRAPDMPKWAAIWMYLADVAEGKA